VNGTAAAAHRFDGLGVETRAAVRLPLSDSGILAEKGFHLTNRTAAGSTARSA
jgi:hypothetical protein